MRPVLSLLAILLAGDVSAAGMDPLRDLERARTLVEAGHFRLARVYLEPITIHPRLPSGHRSAAYYYRGFAYRADAFHVSAAQDFARALDYNPDNAAALMGLAHLFARGDGVQHDPAQAMRLALRAAGTGHPPAAFYVGHAYLTGTGTARDLERARHWLESAAEQGIAAALTQLGHSYRSGFTNDPDPEHAAALLQRAIDLGNDEALVALAYMHLNGELDDASPAQALTLLEQAAAREHAPALHALAGLYMDPERTAAGVVARPDYPRAAEYCERAVALDHVPAYPQCAWLFGSGRLGEPDLARAQAYLRAGARHGDSFSQLALANLLLGDGTREAVTEAQRWYRAAAAKGSTEAMNNLAWSLATNEHDELRDGEAALAAANAAIGKSPLPAYLDTAAAAHAELGDFDKAVAMQRRAIEALDDDAAALRDEFAHRLEAYRAQRPWRE